jgi:ATP-dependent DNA helicase RecQ
VTAVPSQRRPELVADFARRLADAIGLPYVPALTMVKETTQQDRLENSRQQFLNVQGAFAADRAALEPGPALLVDDTVVSRWTQTEAGRALRRAGVPAVVPFGLAYLTAG